MRLTLSVNGRAAMSIAFEVNGKPVDVDVEPRTTLADCLRHHLRLTGTHVGCEHGVCGACTVLVDGEPMSSCLLLAPLAQGREVTTVEGLGGEHPVQRAFAQSHALQCGYCTPGMILTVKRFLEENPQPNDEEIKRALAGNLCRCGCYTRIVDAVKRVDT